MALNWGDAWRVLFNDLPERTQSEPTQPEQVPPSAVREVIGKASTVTLYRWRRDTGRVETKFDGYIGSYKAKCYEDCYAHTCEQAHEKAEGQPVVAVECIRVGKSYFATESLKSLTVLPKPRVEK